ncbi:VWA domain-containing protein [Yimella sp. NH-Cas1]|uniref:VWA domain-containing protein n=1 Tax=Yimella sp. NH-Cas1 TaxID=2917726 RepID=UPI001EFC2261|nr:VWA domain-containing protein [Yimella sp. NH-Cas1]MCG8656680.1 VWA domain-containing protein [Yimella sp. NH-Cas1]
MSQFPFAAIVGADDMALALVLTTVSPEVGGVLVRGEKGTAKSTMVRALAEVLPDVEVVERCRFGCDPRRDERCPDGPHDDAPTRMRPARLVELPVGATEDRVVGSLDLGKALAAGETSFEPGLLAQAHRGLLYVDEVNLLHDHLVDLLLDAAAMGRNTVERDGVSVSHAARVTLVGTMNPEEGELRPQLLDRFGLTVEVRASRDPQHRAEVVRRRLAFDADPIAFTDRFRPEQQKLRSRLHDASARVASVRLGDRALATIARVCAGFDVDGMRADIVTARAARAHAAWCGRDEVTKDDIRVAARLALPHRRRRNPFDAPGLDEELLDRLLDEDPDPDGPEPDGPDDPEPDGPQPDESGDESADESGDESSESGDAGDGGSPGKPADDRSTTPSASGPAGDNSDNRADSPAGDDASDNAAPTERPSAVGVAAPNSAFRARTFTVHGIGTGSAGRRSAAITSAGRTIGSTRRADGAQRLHLPATITAAAPRQHERGRRDGRLRFATDDVRLRITQGKESNLVLFAVDASGSMGARQRMSEVKTAVMSLLVDAYQRRDRVGVISFAGAGANLVLPPTGSVEAAARCLSDLPHGGRTPLAEGLLRTLATVQVERLRDPHRRPLVVVLTDGRATAGPDALVRAREIATAWPTLGLQTVVVDCESGRFRMGLAVDLAARMGAEYVPLERVAATEIVDMVRRSTGAGKAA